MTTVLAVLLVIGLPQLMAFAVLRQRRPAATMRRLFAMAAAFAAAMAVVLVAARMELGKPFDEAGSPEYGMFVLAGGVVAGVLNAAIALLLPRRPG